MQLTLLAEKLAITSPEATDRVGVPDHDRPPAVGFALCRVRSTYPAGRVGLVERRAPLPKVGMDYFSPRVAGYKLCDRAGGRRMAILGEDVSPSSMGVVC
jgi:hypothetical protein